MKEVEENKKKCFCSSCIFSEPSFNLIFCTLKRETKGYQDYCHNWEEKTKRKEQKNQYITNRK